MSLASIVKPVFQANASIIATAMTCRTLTAGTWSGTSAIYAEIKALTIGHELDEHAGATVKRQRATAKVYDTTAAAAPTLRLGDEIIDASSVYWTVSGIDKADVGNGIYRYHLVRDVPLRAGPDRGDHKAEGAS